MKLQTIFNRVKKHLLKQGKRSFRGEENTTDMLCLYLAEDGRKCAIGCLIDEDSNLLPQDTPYDNLIRQSDGKAQEQYRNLRTGYLVGKGLMTSEISIATLPC